MNFKRLNLLILLFVFILLCFVVYKTSPKEKVSFYYDILKKQEDTRGIINISDLEKKEIFTCVGKEGWGFKKKELKEIAKNINKNISKTINSDECLRLFYDKYTIKNGPEKAFAHLARIQLEYPELLPGCHYISHGIGHANLRLNKNDPVQAFTIMQQVGYFKNIASCGNGYFHGVIEEFAKNTKNKEDLVKLLKPVCENKKVIGAGGCFHGVGHAAVVQTADVKNSLYVCDGITQNKVDLFHCHTGVFMEAVSSIELDFVEVKDGVMSYKFCDSQEEKYQTACYMEQSSGENYSNERQNYTRNIGFCKNIKEDNLRMSCIKLNAIRSVRIVRYVDIKNMCENTSSKYEQVMCAAIIAQRIGSSIDKTGKSEVSVNATKDVCRTLGIVKQIQCFNMAFYSQKQLFHVSDKDFKFIPITFKNFYNLML